MRLARLYCALRGCSKQAILSNFAKWCNNDAYRAVLAENQACFGDKILTDKSGAILKDLGGYIVDAFAIARWGLRNFNAFDSGMLAVLQLGGDTDTNCAIYGQLAGAYYGYEAIPKEWREDVYLAGELVDVADELLALDPCPIIRTRFEDNRYFQDKQTLR